MMLCPDHCGELQTVEYEGVGIELCANCRGVWLDFGRLTHIVKSTERHWPGEKVQAVLRKLESYNAPPLGEDRELHCPVCERMLDEVNYQGVSNIIVNPCANLHGVWLDAGELVSIQIYMEHWNRYASEHAEEIQATMTAIVKDYEQRVQERLLETGPASSSEVNRLVFETLERLDEWRRTGA